MVIGQARYDAPVIPLRFVVLALGVALGVFYPFISVILAERFGFEPGEIGLISSIGAIGFTLAVPAWGHLADVRLGRPRTLQVCAIGAAVAVGSLLLPWPAVVIAALFAVFWIFESSWQPLADAITVNTVDRRGYARIRLLTSLSFAIAAILSGFLYDRTGYTPAFVLCVAAGVVMAAAALGVGDVERTDLSAHDRPAGDMARGGDRQTGGVSHRGGDSHLGSRSRRRHLLGSSGVAMRVAPRLGLVLTAVTLLHVGIISGFTFLGLRIIDLGGSQSDVGLASGLSAGSEIPAMLIAAPVARWIGLRGMFVGSALLYAACLASWTVIAVPEVIVATRLLTGVAFAWVIVAVVLTIARLLPPDLQATGQSLYQTTAFGVAAIIANIVGGLLYEAIGPGATFGLGAVLALAAAVTGWFAFPGREPAATPVAG